MSRNNSISRDQSGSRLDLPGLGAVIGALTSSHNRAERSEDSEASSSEEETRGKTSGNGSSDRVQSEDNSSSSRHDSDQEKESRRQDKGEGSSRDLGEADIGTAHDDQDEYYVPPNRLSKDAPLSARAAAVGTGLPTSNVDSEETWRRNRKITIVESDRAQ